MGYQASMMFGRHSDRIQAQVQSLALAAARVFDIDSIRYLSFIFRMLPSQLG